MSDEPEADAVEGDADGDTEEPGNDPEVEGEAPEPEASEPVAEEESADGDGDAAAESEGLQEGDFVELEYTVRTVEDDLLIDTTDADLAEDEEMETEGRDFGPKTIALGGEYLFDEVEADLYGKAVGDSGSVTIPAESAFGEYDPEQVRTISADRIPEDSRQPGAHVQIDGQSGHVETIIGGRARVDFNHPLAGEDIEYEYHVVDKVTDRTERARGLLGMYLDVGGLDMEIVTEEEERTVYDDEGDEESTETVEVDVLYIEATPQLAMNQQWMFSKQQIAQEIIDRIGVDRVVVQEVLEGMGGMGGLGGLGGGGLEEMIGDADLDDVDAEELASELDIDDLDPESDEPGEAEHDHDH